MTLFINGRFTVQKLSGVQRFAQEVTRALQACDPRYVLLTPQGGCSAGQNVCEIGKRQGQRWEQIDLPRAAGDGFLINLGNTGPMIAKNQIIVLHDTGIFDTPEAYSARFRLWYRFLQEILIRRGATIVTVSEFSRRQILHYLPAKPEQVRVMPEGVDHIWRIRADPDFLSCHNLEPGRFVLGVGTAAAHKNLAALEPLGQRLKARGLSLVLAGGLGGNAFQTSSLPQSAHYIGRVTDSQLKTLYQTAGCFVFPSRYEGFGLPPLEAMACGCPVVASDIPPLRETCFGAAQFCDPKSPEDIAAKVLNILDSKQLQTELRETGKLHASAFTWLKAAETLNLIVTEIEGQRNIRNQYPDIIYS